MGEHPVPIEYGAILMGEDGHESHLDFDEPGWTERDDVIDARIVTFRPKPGSEELPTISVHLGPQADGTVRKLVYFSRVFGTLSGGGDSYTQSPLFRMYCIGWESTIDVPSPDPTLPPYAQVHFKNVNWVIPRGSVIMADEPPPTYVNDLIQHYLTRNLPHDETLAEAEARAGEPPLAEAQQS